MTQEPFPRSALESNRAGRLTAEQIRALHTDAVESRRSGVMAGLAVTAFGLLIVWGALSGRAPGSTFWTLATGAVFSVIGAILLISRGMTRGPKASEAASESTVLDIVEGPFHRERRDRQTDLAMMGYNHSLRASQRYEYFLFVGDRRMNVGQPAYDAAPEDGIVRAYVLPDSDRIVNLERIADAPPTAIETWAAAKLQELAGPLPGGERPSPSAKGATCTPAELRAALIGRWEGMGIRVKLEFRSDGTVMAGGSSDGKEKRWEVVASDRIRVAGEEQRAEVDGEVLTLSTRGPTLRFHRVP